MDSAASWSTSGLIEFCFKLARYHVWDGQAMDSKYYITCMYDVRTRNRIGVGR
jgi:hypothetical protein